MHRSGYCSGWLLFPRVFHPPAVTLLMRTSLRIHPARSIGICRPGASRLERHRSSRSVHRNSHGLRGWEEWVRGSLQNSGYGLGIASLL
jgi:hypothetical protein